jgi:hypothetical protein
MQNLSYFQKVDMTYKAMFGERDPNTLKLRVGLYDIVKWLIISNAVLVAHAFGVPTEKLGEMVVNFFTASGSVLRHH